VQRLRDHERMKMPWNGTRLPRSIAIEYASLVKAYGTV